MIHETSCRSKFAEYENLKGLDGLSDIFPSFKFAKLLPMSVHLISVLLLNTIRKSPTRTVGCLVHQDGWKKSNIEKVVELASIKVYWLPGRALWQIILHVYAKRVIDWLINDWLFEWMHNCAFHANIICCVPRTGIPILYRVDDVKLNLLACTWCNRIHPCCQS